jgi:TonB family protein
MGHSDVQFSPMKLWTLLPLLCLAWLRATAQTACTGPHPDAKYTGPVKRGRIIEQPSPVYPESAKARGISGCVRVREHVLVDGTIGHITVLSGPPELHEATAKAFYRSRYAPWTVNSQPVDAYTTSPACFTLPQTALPAGARPAGQQVSALALQGLLVRSYQAKRSKEAARGNISGTVTLQITLDETGHIVDLGVSCGPEALEDAALETVRHWVYRPYVSNGQPTAVKSTIVIVF